MSFNDKGDLIKDMRLKKGISLRELSRRSGVNESRISKIENGLHGMTNGNAMDMLIGLEYSEEEADKIIKEWALEALGVR